MNTKNLFFRPTAAACVFLMLVVIAAPVYTADSCAGEPLSNEELAELAAAEKDDPALETISSGSALALIGAVVVVYFVWEWLRKKH